MDWQTWGPPLVVLSIGIAVGLGLALTAGGQRAIEDDRTARREDLTAEKATLLEQIRSLDADRDKLGESEYARRREELVGLAAKVLAELEALEKAPLTHFYDLDSAPDLLEEDRVLLRTHLSRALGDDTADTVLAVLLPALERALRADPDRRATSARELLAACVLGREKAGLAPTRLVERLIGPVMDAPAPADRRQAPKRRPKWPLVVGLSAGLGAVVTVGLLWAFWPRTEALSAEEAAELGIPVELAAPRLTMRYAGDPDAHIVLGGLRSKGSRLPPQPLPPGEHRVQLLADAGQSEVVSITLAAAEQRTVALQLRPPEEAQTTDDGGDGTATQGDVDDGAGGSAAMLYGGIGLIGAAVVGALVGVAIGGAGYAANFTTSLDPATRTITGLVGDAALTAAVVVLVAGVAGGGALVAFGVVGE